MHTTTISKMSTTVILDPIRLLQFEQIKQQNKIICPKQFCDRMRAICQIDIYQLFNIINELHFNLENLPKGQMPRHYLSLFMMVLNQFFQSYGTLSFHTDKLLRHIKFANRIWKRELILQKQAIVFHNISDPLKTFNYIFKRNYYLYQMMKCNNTIIEKMIQKALSTKKLNLKAIMYLKDTKFKQLDSLIFKRMNIILNEFDEEAHTKVKLVNQFIKYVLLEANICLDKQQFRITFQRFNLISKYAFRIIKKFYSPLIYEDISETKQLIKKGLDMQLKILQRQKKNINKTKIRHLSNILTLLLNDHSSKSIISDQNQSYQSNKAFTLRLGYKLLSSWKQIFNQQKKKLKVINEKKQMQADTKGIKQTKRKLSQKDLHKKIVVRSKSMIWKKNSEANKQPELAPVNKIRVRKQIEGFIEKQFSKLNYLKKLENQPQLKMRSASLQNNWKQMKLEEYDKLIHMRAKRVQTVNKIQLYKPGSTLQFDSKKSKFQRKASHKLTLS